MRKKPSMRSERDGRQAPAVVADWVTSIAVGVASTALFALLGDGFQLETVVVAGLCMGTSLVVALRHGGIRSHVRRLRERPNDLPSR
jgi:hypothetical protein